MTALRRLATPALVALAAIAFTVTAENVSLARWFPHLLRFTTDFSPAYLQRELAYERGRPAQTIFLGDSVVWGYRLPASANAVSILEANGCACANFALKTGSPPNYYALAKLMVARGVRPSLVVIEINQKAFNAEDATYQTLHPGIAALAEPLLSAQDAATLAGIPDDAGIRAHLDRDLDSLSLLYAMRSDVRETLYGDADGVVVAHPTAQLFEGTYDLSPLSESNVGVRYLERTLDTLHAAGIPVLAFMTPTNHAMLHAYIDAPQYRANVEYLARVARSRGARVVDWDRAMPGRFFFDNAHLRASGQRRLAALLATSLGLKLSR